MFLLDIYIIFYLKLIFSKAWEFCIFKVFITSILLLFIPYKYRIFMYLPTDNYNLFIKTHF